MKYINSIKTSLLIILICFCTFCSGYTMGSSFVFADSTTDNWTQVTTNEQLVEAFRYYCKSRDLTIDGSLADGVTKFTTDTFNGLCNTLGINITALQAHLKYETDGNLGYKFLFDTVGISAYNRIFSQFLQDNDLSVGDTVNKNLYSGILFNDGDGHTSFVYVSHGIPVDNKVSDKQIVLGTYFRYTSGTIISMIDANLTTFSFKIFNSTFNNNLLYSETSRYKVYGINNINVDMSNGKIYIDRFGNSGNLYSGHVAILLNTSNGKYYVGTWTETIRDWDNYSEVYTFSSYGEIVFPQNAQQPQNCTIYVTTNNNTINNNNYEGDTIINNNGTPSEPDVPIPDPEPDYQPAEDWDIDLPDLSVPNWILSGKENKFPFDIPFNVMYALSLLQAEPEAPKLEGTLDFGFYEWEYDLDLSDFDPVAEICRNMEVLAFITGLMLMTRKLIWG